MRPGAPGLASARLTASGLNRPKVRLTTIVSCNSADLAPRRIDLLGLLVWHIILVLAQPRRKRDPHPTAREATALGEIVEDHLGRVLVCYGQLRHDALEGEGHGQSGQHISVGGASHRPLTEPPA